MWFWWLLAILGINRIARAEEVRAALEWQALLDAERALFAAWPRCFEPPAEPFVAAPLDLTADIEAPDCETIEGEFRDVTPSRWFRARPLVARREDRLLLPR